MANLKKSKTNTLVWHPNYVGTHLKFAGTSWYARSGTSKSFAYHASAEAPATKAGINTSPASLYGGVYSQVLANLTLESNGGLMMQAAVGSAYDRPGPARVQLYGVSAIVTLTAPAFKVTSARISGTGGGYGGLFTSWPSGSSLMSSSYRTGVSSKIALTSAEIDMLNNAAAGTSLYFGLAAMPPASYTGTDTSHSWTNDGDDEYNFAGFIVQPGETLNWLTGFMSFTNPAVNLNSTFDIQY